ncbi:Maf family protein [Patescibacteria group bacterium]|nr:Maf family protein [Patescibacteria group bacterium]MBU4452714.1 Maf family protein [Patescibacteria group bacterium]
MKLILGSSSIGRQEILRRAGHSFEIIKPEIDEQAIRCDNPRELVVKLANAKADAILAKLGLNIDPDTIIITSDQVVVCNGQVLEKPKDEHEARYFISLYHQYPAEIVNGLVLTNTKNQRAQGLDVSETLLSEAIPTELINQIIAKGQIFNCAGAIQFEDPLIAPYIKFLNASEDKLRGMPMELLKKLLLELQS